MIVCVQNLEKCWIHLFCNWFIDQTYRIANRLDKRKREIIVLELLRELGRIDDTEDCVSECGYKRNERCRRASLPPSATLCYLSSLPARCGSDKGRWKRSD